MANRNRAEEILNGIIINRETNNGGAFITSGSTSPVGDTLLSTMIAGDLYIQNSGSKPILWQKIGASINDWRQLSAQDIPALDQDMLPTTTQALLDQFGSGGGSGVSQTGIFGSGGNTSQNSYIPNQGVPSNVVGIPIGITNAKLRNMFLGNENTRTGDVLVQQRFPAGTGTFTTIYTMTLANQSFRSDVGLEISITTGAEIAIFTTVSLKNVKVVLNINGDSAA